MATTKSSDTLVPTNTNKGTSSAFLLSHLLSTTPSSYKIFLLVIAIVAYNINNNNSIPIRHVLFCILFPFYLILINHLRFNNNRTIRQRPINHPYNVSVITSSLFIQENTSWFKKYMLFAATIGLILPFITIVTAWDNEVATLAMPHLFVLVCQIVGESMTKYNPNVHRYITLLMILGFSIYRLSLLLEWFTGSVSLSVSLYNWNDGIDGRCWVILLGWGIILSSINLLFWTYNLFVTILLQIVPEYLSIDKCEFYN